MTNLLDAHLINPQLDIRVFKTIDSTNTYLKQFLNKAYIKKPVICLSEQQTQGRGRFGRHWHSPFGKNLYFSCLYDFQKDISELSGLSLVVSLAIINTLKKYPLPESPLIKWPNDILYQTQKLAGSLIEIKADVRGICQAIIGIGMNINMLAHHDNEGVISQSWTSLRRILNVSIDRNALCASLIEHLLAYIKKFELSGLSEFMAEWHTVDYLFNQKIILSTGGQILSGIAQGINAQGHLLLKLKTGKIQAFSSGDTTVKRL